MARRKRKAHKDGIALKKITPSYLARRCGILCPIHPPEPFKTWEDYLQHTTKAPAPYRSWLEFRLFAYGACREYGFETKVVPYTVLEKRDYHIDGVVTDKIWIEVKGRFRSRAEHDKYIWVRNSNPTCHLIFLFDKPGVPMPGSRERKDGTRRSMEEWAEENGFKYTFEALAKIDLPRIIKEIQNETPK